MRQRDETDPEGPELDASAALNHIQLHLPGEPLLVELAGDEPGSERRREQGRTELLREVGKSTDMNLMAMRQDNACETLLLSFDELEVGKDQLDSRVGRVGEGEAEVDHDPLAAAAVQIDVHADLAGAAEGDEKQFFSGNHRGARIAMSYSRLKPWIVRSGSIASNTFVCLSNRAARPPVATTVSGRPTSRLIRSVKPSSMAT